jgi:SAM-dependent methyltransferase
MNYEKHYGNGNLEKWENQGWAWKRAKFVSELINSSGSLLDIAGYKGDLKQYLPKGIEYNLIDIIETDLPEQVRWDLNKIPLPYKNKSFDIIVAIDIFEHVNNPFDLRREIKRILKDDGYAILGLSTRRVKGHNIYLKEDFINDFKIIKRIGIIGGKVPIMRVPLIIASEIFYKVKK